MAPLSFGGEPLLSLAARSLVRCPDMTACGSRITTLDLAWQTELHPSLSRLTELRQQSIDEAATVSGGHFVYRCIAEEHRGSEWPYRSVLEEIGLDLWSVSQDCWCLATVKSVKPPQFAPCRPPS